MSDMGDMWRAMREHSRGMKRARGDMNMQALEVARGQGLLEYSTIGDHLVIRLCGASAEVHYWPTTGTAAHKNTYRKGLIVADIVTWLQQLEGVAGR